MAAINLSEYIGTLRMNPHAVNEGTWFARGTIEHNGRTYKAGNKLPNDGDHALTNEQVAQLLEVNALTSVNPNKDQHEAAQSQDQGNDQGGTPPSGADRLDENGNPIQPGGAQ